MTALGLVTTLIGFVFGFSLGQLLLRIGALATARENVRFSGLGALAIVAAVLLVLLDWLSLYDFHDIGHWTLLDFSSLFVLALTVSFICMISAPAVHSGPVDMEAFYWHQRKVLYWAWIGCELLAIGSNLLLARGHDKLLAENVDNVAALLVVILPLAVPHRWAQWTGLLLLIAVNFAFLVLFDAAFE